MLHVCIIVATVFSLFPKTTPAYARNTVDAGVGHPMVAQTTGDIDPCDLVPIPFGVVCDQIYPPPEILYLEQGIFTATPEQTASLRNLEDQAVAIVLALHGLPPEDEAAVRTWGRDDVLAQLYLLLVGAINTEAAERTTDQQNAVDWLVTLVQRQELDLAQNAAREYVKWAGLGRGNFDALMRTNPTKAQIEAFLSGQVVNYDFPGGVSTEGWCVYRSPAPYAGEYTGYNNPLCSGPVLGFVLPPTPSYDEFVKWGAAKSSYPLLSSPAFQSRVDKLGIALGIAVPLSVVISSSALAAAAVIQAAYLTAAGIEAAEIGFIASAPAVSAASQAANVFRIVGAFSLALTLIAAIATAVLVGINVTDAANLPGKLATLIDTARTNTPDVATLMSDTDTTTNLVTLFAGATTPMPKLESCDNSLTLPPGMYELTVIGSDETRLISSTPCLNPTLIPDPTPTDLQFLVKNAGGSERLAPSITVKDTDANTLTTVRLSGNWFVAESGGATVQTLRIAYTDWDGVKQNAWMIGNAADGYAFLTSASLTDTSTTLDPDTCLTDGTCGAGPAIEYIGADGRQYSATVRAYQPPTGAPTVTSAFEGSPATLNANGFAPGGAVAPVTYQWSFKADSCNTFTCTTVATATGATTTYTWQAGGAYRVDLTATDAVGAQATTSLLVSVGSAPPTFTLAPDCATSPNVPCNTWSVDPGRSVTIRGTLAYVGSQSRFELRVDMGDGNGYLVFIGSDGSVSTIPGFTTPVTVTRVGSQLAYTVLVPHTYANSGVYNGSVTVKKVIGLSGDGGTVSQPFTVNVKGNQTISFSTVGGSSYGNVFPISATGGASGQPVTFTTNSICTLSNVSGGAGTGSATVTMVSAGECTITARQAGSAAYNPAPDVTRRVISLLAPLTITAPSPTIVYGQPVPALTPGYSGFKLNDSESTLTTPATCAVAANSGAVGTYAITCAGAAGANYSTDYVPGTLTITKAPLTITANNKTIVYGQAVPSFDATFSGLVNGESSSVVSGLSCGARDGNGQAVSSSTPIGSYPITCSGGSAANYSLSYVAGTLSINKAATTTSVRATPGSSLLGQAVTFTAAVAVSSPGSGTPSGTVNFTDGAASIAGCAAVPINPASGTATCTTSALSVGQRTISARYSGAANFAASSATPASYTVAYGFSGFSGPVNNPPTVNTSNAGRNIPLKWRVTNAAGNPITNLSSVSVTSVVGGCSAGAPSDGVEEYVATGSGLQNLGNGYYQFNWKTERSWAGTCRTLRLNLGDGRIHTALFQFR